MKTHLLILLTLLALAACKKDDLDPDGLVPATQTGKNTGDFLVNGAPYRPGRKSAYAWQAAVGANWYKIRGGRKIVVFLSRQFDNDESVVNITLSRITGPSTFFIMDGVSPYVVAGDKSFIVYGKDDPNPQQYFLTGPTAIGRVEVTRYDTVAHVVSGTFEAKLREYQGPDSLSITKGRFDCTF